MHEMYWFLLVMAIPGAVGTAISTRNAGKELGRARWLKFAVYIGILLVLIRSTELGWFPCVAPLIALGFLAETAFHAFRGKFGTRRVMVITSVLLGLALAGFLLWSREADPDAVLYVLLVVASFDAFSQVSGQVFGRTPLLPSVSPLKTVEGLAGGIMVGLLAAVLAGSWTPDHELPSLARGLVIIFFALAGDLLASALKRHLGIKDFSRVIPGHGGIIDRFDSFVLGGAGWYLLQLCC